MTKAHGLFVLLTFAACVAMDSLAQGTPLTLSISTERSDYMLAEPVCVTVTLTNTSKERLIIEEPSVDHNLEIAARNPDGRLSGLGWESSVYASVHSEIEGCKSDGSCSLAPGAVYSVTLCGLLGARTETSEWEVWAEFTARGSFLPVVLVLPGAPPQEPNCKGCWKGVVKSNRLRLRFTNPTGPELDPYQRLIRPHYSPDGRDGGRDWYRDVALISEYPTSLYSTWVRFTAVQSGMYLYCKPLEAQGSGLKQLPFQRFLYSPNNRAQLSQPEQFRAPYLIEQCRLILRYHPNLNPLSSVTRLDLAALLYIAGDTPGAREQLCAVIKAYPESQEGKAAKQMLDVIEASPEGKAPTGGA